MSVRRCPWCGHAMWAHFAVVYLCGVVQALVLVWVVVDRG